MSIIFVTLHIYFVDIACWILLGSCTRWANFLFICWTYLVVKSRLLESDDQHHPYVPFYLRMPPSANNIKNSGAVHLSYITVLSNPHCLSTANNIPLDLHLLIVRTGSPPNPNSSCPEIQPNTTNSRGPNNRYTMV